jgi:endonuclease/exonuclease/phosphatase family metal-dependent hydrolase
MSTFRIASFNVENLFARPKVFNFKDKSVGDELLKRIGNFRELLKKDSYSAATKKKIFEEFTITTATKPALKDFILIREDQGKLWSKQGWAIKGVKANGSGDWNGTIEFKKAKFSEVGRKNTAKVIRKVKADVACIVEADNRPGLRSFDSDLLSSSYPYEMLLDGNDQRGIDVGLYSKFPLGTIRTHMFDKSPNSNSKIFSRDCPEYEVILPNNQSILMLCNHLKSKGYGAQATSNDRRKKQAQAIADILSRYDLANDWVIVAGDLNDTRDSDPLSPLIQLPNLFDVLELEFGSQMHKRWTYHYKSFEQIDYVLVSKPLKDRFVKAGVERRGMYNLKKLTASNASIPNETQFSSVTHWTNAASDHGAVWADFNL